MDNPAIADNLGLIGESDAMNSLRERIARYAKNDLTVLICGETGVGKERVAKAIHLRSPRNKKPFVAVNVAAINPALLESELFGHVKGSFTGATEDRPGKFRSANEGSIFLDEIGDAGDGVQRALLRVLQEKKVMRVGQNTEEDIDVRVIAATNKLLTQAVQNRDFRDDLYHRLNVLTLVIPPLRDRGDEDVILLAEHFARSVCDEFKAFSERAKELLKAYAWPGNVRELENTVRRTLASISLLDGIVEDIVFDELSRLAGGATKQEAPENSADAVAAIVFDDLMNDRIPLMGILPKATELGALARSIVNGTCRGLENYFSTDKGKRAKKNLGNRTLRVLIGLTERKGGSPSKLRDELHETVTKLLEKLKDQNRLP